jgi:hypothetical protein
MKIKPVFIAIAVVGALLLVLSLSNLAKIFGANPRDVVGGVKTQPQAVQFLPKRSPAFISFLVNPDKLELFAQLASKPSDRANVRHQLGNLKQQLRQNWLLDYEKDIQPWLDQEITLAITDTDLDQQSDNGLQAGYLLAFTAKDDNLAKTTINAFWQRLAVNGSDLAFEQYQGVSIVSSPLISGTTLGKFVLFANAPQIIRKAINNLQVPSLAIASLDSYGDRLTKIDRSVGKGKVAIAYVNLAELGAGIPQESWLTSLSIDKSTIRATTFLAPQNPVTASSDKLEPSHDLTSRQNNSALKLLPKPNSLPDWLLTVTVKDPKASATSIASFDHLARTKLTVGEIALESQPVTIWTRLNAIANRSADSSSSEISGTVVAAHAQTQNYIYLSNSLPNLKVALKLKA